MTDKQPGLLEALDELVEPETRGNPMSLLRWTSKSAANLATELAHQGFEVSPRTVLRLLHQLGYSLRANAKVTGNCSGLLTPASTTCAIDARTVGNSDPRSIP